MPVGGERYYDAFWWCNKRRKYLTGMAVAPLALEATEMIAYAGAHELDIEETLFMVDRLDTVWMEWYDAQHSSGGAATRAPASEAE